MTWTAYTQSEALQTAFSADGLNGVNQLLDQHFQTCYLRRCRRRDHTASRRAVCGPSYGYSAEACNDRRRLIEPNARRHEDRSHAYSNQRWAEQQRTESWRHTTIALQPAVLKNSVNWS